MGRMSFLRRQAATWIPVLERYLQMDLRYFLSGGLWLSAGHVANAGISFVSSVALANLVPKEVFGTYRYLLSLASVINAFSLTGTAAAVVQSVARGYDAAVSQGFWLTLRWSGGIILICTIGAGYYFFQGNSTLAIGLLLIGMSSPILNSVTLYASLLNGKKDFVRLSLFNTVRTLIPALCLLSALLLTEQVLLITGAYLGASVLTAALLYWQATRQYPAGAGTDPGLASYSKRLSLFNIVSGISVHLDKVLVFTQLGAVELALYAIASAFPEQTKSLLQQVSTLMVPRFSERTLVPGQPLFLRRKLWQFLCVLGAGIVGYVVAAPLLFAIFFPAYTESVLFSQVYALCIVGAMAIIPNSVLVSQKMERELAYLNVVGSLTRLALLFPLIHFWGLWGAVAARVLISSFMTGYTLLLTHRRFPLR